MTERDKELAEQAGLLGPSSRVGNSHEAAEKFANLIRADAMEAATRAANESWSLACKKMVEFEREACAKVCAALMESPELIGDCHVCVDAIRARGNT
jgi:hypothetical protein